ncbi:MAG: PAS domain-containing protein [Cellvibrionaceae bacterium]|nr:PAS domain-containing protein [Cellvibrionaceae bacterium]
MRDMQAQDVVPGCEQWIQPLYAEEPRRLYVSEEEVPYPDGRLIVSSTDLQGIITFCNDSFVQMSGYSEEELMGQPHSILRHPDIPRVAFVDLWQTVQAGKRWQGYVKNLRKDGRFYWVYATVVPNKRGGVIKGYTSVRRKPSRSKVAEAEALYKKLLAEQAP